MWMSPNYRAQEERNFLLTKTQKPHLFPKYSLFFYLNTWCIKHICRSLNKLLISSLIFCKDFNWSNRKKSKSSVYIFHTRYWVSQQLVLLCIYLKSMRSISDIVHLLPLLFSPIANLGQLYATRRSHWIAWLLLCAKRKCLEWLIRGMQSEKFCIMQCYEM